MSIGSFIKTIGRILFVILNNIYCIPTFCIWMFLLHPLKYYKPDLYWKIEGTFFHWLLAMVSMWSWSAGYDISEVGDDIRLCLDDRTLVVVNHQSTADVPMLMACFNSKKGVLPNIMWIMDRVFKFTNFGIVSVLHEDFFILSGRDCREEAIHLLKKHLRESYIPLNRKLMVLFPEGGFLRKRRETSKRYALKHNLPLLNNVSLPRMGAMHAIVDVLNEGVVENNSSGPGETVTPVSLDKNDKPNDWKPEAGPQTNYPNKLDWVLDITIAYPEGKPLDLPTIVTASRPPCQTFLFYRLYPASLLPSTHEEITQWLIDRWVEKDQILDEYYKTGKLPVSDYCPNALPPQPVVQDNLRLLIINLFFIASTYLHFRLLTLALSFIW